MNLNQRRAVAEFQENYFTNWKKQIGEVVGFDVPVDVKWDTLFYKADSDEPKALMGYWEKIFFEPTLKTMQAICVDDMAKSAIKTGLKGISMAGGDPYSPESSGTFENGVFSITHQPNANIDDGEKRARAWQKLIEAKL